jgi:two-component system nitrate/nitrite response regulator NarL
MQKLLIVDDHRLFAEGIRFLIEQSTDYEVVRMLHKGNEVLPFLSKNDIDMVLLDIDLPDISGFEVAMVIRNYYPRIKILALSMVNDLQSIKRMIDAGAMGYCNKSDGREDLFRAIQKIVVGEVYLPLDYLKQMQFQKMQPVNHILTKRETEIIGLISNGKTTNQIASQLFLSTNTIETHRKNIYRKLEISTNVELTLYAKSNRII